MFPWKLHFDPQVLAEIYRQDPAMLDEMAIPSYLHANPLIRWVVGRRMHIVLKMLRPTAQERIVDFGCGTGMLFLQLAPNPGAYIGVDRILWPGERVLAHHGRNDVQLLHADAWASALADASVDKIVALEVLEHVDDVADLANLFWRKLKPGGRLIVSGPTENLFYQLGRKMAGFSGEYHRRNIDQIMPDVIQAGFRVQASQALPLPVLFTAFRLYLLEKTAQGY